MIRAGYSCEDVLVPMNSPKILLIDGNRKDRDAVSAFLGGEGYVVECADNGNEGLEKTRQEKFDLVILDLILPRIPAVKAAVDIGCGVGAWLSVLQEKGTPDIVGYDGPWVEESMLKIPVSSFVRTDLSQSLKLGRTYDLAISLEVAEHLPESRAPGFVEDLSRASPFILFSAAIPFQGGYHHVNEQWQSYWVDLFHQQGYHMLDWVRPRIWNEENIPVWYRENIFLFVSQDRVPDLRPSPDGVADVSLPVNIVHPEMYLPKVNPDSVRYGLSLAKRAFKKRWTPSP